MGASGKPEILREVEDLEKDIDERKRAVRDLERKRRDAIKKRESWLTLLGIVLVTLFVTSSCSLHAGQLLGQWDAEQVLSAVIDPVLGFVNKFKETNTALYVIASVLATVLMLPINLLVAFPYGFLKLAAGVLELTVPAVLPFVPYVEAGLVLLVLVKVAFPVVSGLYANNRSVRADVRAIDAEIRGRGTDQSTRLAALKRSREYQEAHRQWQARLDRAKQMLPQFLPTDVSASSLDGYVREDPAKAVEIARTLNMAMTNQVIELTLSPDGKIGGDRQAYLDTFKLLFENEDVEGLRQMQEGIQQQVQLKQLRELADELEKLFGEGPEEPEAPGTFRGKHARK